MLFILAKIIFRKCQQMFPSMSPWIGLVTVKLGSKLGGSSLLVGAQVMSTRSWTGIPLKKILQCAARRAQQITFELDRHKGQALFIGHIVHHCLWHLVECILIFSLMWVSSGKKHGKHKNSWSHPCAAFDHKIARRSCQMFSRKIPRVWLSQYLL